MFFPDFCFPTHIITYNRSIIKMLVSEDNKCSNAPSRLLCSGKTAWLVGNIDDAIKLAHTLLYNQN